MSNDKIKEAVERELKMDRIDKVRIVIEADVIPPNHLREKDLAKYGKGIVMAALNDKLILRDYKIEFNPIKSDNKEKQMYMGTLQQHIVQRITSKTMERETIKQLEIMKEQGYIIDYD